MIKTTIAAPILAALLFALAIPSSLVAFANLRLDDDDSTESKSNLVPPVAAPDTNAFGKVEISKDGQEQEFEVVANKLSADSPPGPFEVWLESGVGTDVFAKVGDMTLKSAFLGRWELKLEAVGAAPAALGVADVNDTAGRMVQVRDTGGVNVYLQGIISAIGGGGCPPVIPAVKGKMDLQRPESQPDPDAKGHVKLSKKGHEQEFEIEAHRLDAPANAQYDVFLETAIASDVYNAIGGMTLKNAAQGRWKFEVEAECEAPPILGVADLSELPGRRVQIRNNSGNVVLKGVLPPLVSGVGQLNFNLKNKLQLPPVNPPSPKAHGEVRSKFIAPQGQSELEVRVHQLASGNSYSLWLENGPSSGVLEKVGEFSFKGKGNSTKNGEFKVNTKKGQGLPFDANTIADLKNRHLEVRDGQDVVHLTGIVP